MLGAVERRTAGIVPLLRRHDTVPQHFAVTLFVITEQDRGEVIAAPVPLAERGVDLNFQRYIPLCSRAGPLIPRVRQNHPRLLTGSRAPAGSVITARRSLIVHYFRFLKSLIGGLVYRAQAREWLPAHETMFVRAIFLN